MDEQDIRKEYNSQLIKYKYYIIALCVTSIGYSVVRTSEKSLSYIDIPLGLSVLCWSTSVYLGLTFLKRFLGVLNFGITMYDIKNGVHPDVGASPDYINKGMIGINEVSQELRNKAERNSIWQERLFYIGMILFIVWHVLTLV